MSLRTCGTVIDQQQNRVIVRIEQERCTNCTGCVRFNFPKTVSAIGTHAIGERVAIRTSAAQLSLASLVVFGLPILALSLATLVWESRWGLGVALLLSFGAVYLIMRFARLQSFLKIYAESI